MSIGNQIRGLNGAKITREELKNLWRKALEQEQTQLAERLKKILIDSPAEIFELDTTRPIFEETPEYILKNLPFDETPDEEYTGLNKGVSPDDIYQYITDLVLNTIKEVGHLPWQREWEKTSLFNGWQALNFESKKGYRGINFVLTNFKVKITEEGPTLVPRDLTNPYFLTFNQIEKNGGKLKKDSKGVRVVYFTKLYTHTEYNPDTREKILDYGTYNQKKFIAWLKKNRSKIRRIKTDKDLMQMANSYIPILKYYNVFAGEDVEGIDWGKLPKNENVDKPEKERIDIAEAIVKSMPNAPKIQYKGDQPSYYPASDDIFMTPIEAFNNEQSFYSTLFHEMVHATGHSSRLKRFTSVKASKTEYAFEELIAELGAVFLCAESGILFQTLDNSAKYLRGWNSRLVANMEKDNRYFFRAASKSQAAADYILDRNAEGEPAYLKNLVITPIETKKTKAKFKKGEMVFDVKRSKSGTVKKVAIPKENTSLSAENRIYDLVYDNGKKAINIPESRLEKVDDNQEEKPVSKQNKKAGPISVQYELGLAGPPPDGKLQPKEVRAWAEKNLIDTYVYNKDIDAKVIFNKPGIKKVIYGKGRPNQLRMKLLYLAPQLVQKARLISVKKDVSENNRSVLVYHLNTTAVIDEERFDVKILLKENIDLGTIYYYHSGTTIKKQIKSKGDKADPHVASDLLSDVKNTKNEKPAQPVKSAKPKPAKTTGLKTPAKTENTPEPKTTPQRPRPSAVKSMASGASNQNIEYFNIPGETGKFLQRVEKKPVHSVAITLDGPAGGGKTTMFYKWMNDFAAGGNRCLFISLEEHPESSLAIGKRDRFIEPKNQHNIDTVGDIKTVAELYDLVPYYDCIFIDSWQKVTRKVGKIHFDEDLRQRFDGKVFATIFQQTVDGRTKGGADIVFDGDIITKITKMPRFEDNYAWFEKNRYAQQSIEDLRYNIDRGQMYLESGEEPEPETQTPTNQNTSPDHSGLELVIYE
ncbi:MAG: zincin-like metallopeptidase domain-containing protein [Leeuwenhoekiella sp.]